jgi:hypothetical protein
MVFQLEAEAPEGTMVNWKPVPHSKVTREDS